MEIITDKVDLCDVNTHSLAEYSQSNLRFQCPLLIRALAQLPHRCSTGLRYEKLHQLRRGSPTLARENKQETALSVPNELL